MKFLRYGPRGAEKPGLLDADGHVRCLSAHIADIDGAFLARRDAIMAGIDLTALPIIAAPGRIAEPVARVGKFVCIGLNYRDHAVEAKMAIPDEPIIFMKATSAIIGPDDDVLLPPGSAKSDWEVELGVVIGADCRYVGKADAMAHVAGFCVVNDLVGASMHVDRRRSAIAHEQRGDHGRVGQHQHPARVEQDGIEALRHGAPVQPSLSWRNAVTFGQISSYLA